MNYVYLAENESGTVMKIGTTTNPVRRRRTLITNARVLSPQPLGPFRMVAVIRGGTNRERKVQRQFSQYRIRGEWFNHSAEIAEFFKARAVTVPPQPRLFTTDLSAALVARAKRAARRKGLLLMAAVAQAMELWIKQNAD